MALDLSCYLQRGEGGEGAPDKAAKNADMEKVSLLPPPGAHLVQAWRTPLLGLPGEGPLLPMHCMAAHPEGQSLIRRTVQPVRAAPIRGSLHEILN